MASYIDENPAINILDKINEIESFVNTSVSSLSKTREFKVHDLSIDEKIRPFRAFVGNLVSTNLPPTRSIKTEERARADYANTLSRKISNTISNNREMTPSNTKQRRMIQTNFDNAPNIFKKQNRNSGQQKGGINLIRTPQYKERPSHQSTVSQFMTNNRSQNFAKSQWYQR